MRVCIPKEFMRDHGSQNHALLKQSAYTDLAKLHGLQLSLNILV